MAFQHAIAFILHLVLYFALYPFWKKISLSVVGFFFLMQLFGIDLIVLATRTENTKFYFNGAGLILTPFWLAHLMTDRPFRIGKKKYAGMQEFLLLIDTDLKYVIGVFSLSLIINFYLNPLTGTLNYTNITALVAFLVSLPFCRRMRRLKEQQA